MPLNSVASNAITCYIATDFASVLYYVCVVWAHGTCIKVFSIMRVICLGLSLFLFLF